MTGKISQSLSLAQQEADACLNGSVSRNSTYLVTNGDKISLKFYQILSSNSYLTLDSMD